MTTEPGGDPVPATKRRIQWTRALRLEWLGQLAASGFWIVSVLVYGISTTGDWLQLLAACSWMAANVAALVGDEPPTS